MIEQDLAQCSVLVVDDSASSRTLVATTLHDIGVGAVNTVPNGVAAIEHLQHSAMSSMSSPTPPVDLVISEWDMEPVGGLMLVNWIRRSMASPDRFTRTVIMSGSLDVEKVEGARSAGINAVFAKPFTINSLHKHIHNVMHDNPPFFKTNDYFGPDRRRRALDAVLDDRRTIRHPHSEIIGAGEDANVGCFDLPHYLAQVIAGQPRERIDYTQRDAAHQILAEFSEDYADWIYKDVTTLRMAYRSADAKPAMRLRNLSLMQRVASRLEREGDHLGYPLVSAFAHTVINALNTDQRLWHGTAEILETAIIGLETVVRERISGHGGALGQALRRSLVDINQKLLRLQPIRAHRHGLTLVR